MSNLKDFLPNSGQALMSIRFNTFSFALSINSNVENIMLMNYIYETVIYNKTNYSNANGLSIWYPYAVEDFN